MTTFKDKVTERFSRMFTNPPTSPSSAADDENPQVRLYSEGTKLLSSYFSNVIPSAGGSGSRSYESVLSTPLSNGNSHSRNESLDTFEDCRSSGLNGSENDDDPASFGSASGSEAFKEATVQSSPEKQLAYLMDDSVFISSELLEFLLSSLPNIVKGCQWALLYRAVRQNMVYHSAH